MTHNYIIIITLWGKCSKLFQKPMTPNWLQVTLYKYIIQLLYNSNDYSYYLLCMYLPVCGRFQRIVLLTITDDIFIALQKYNQKIFYHLVKTNENLISVSTRTSVRKFDLLHGNEEKCRQVSAVNDTRDAFTQNLLLVLSVTNKWKMPRFILIKLLVSSSSADCFLAKLLTLSIINWTLTSYFSHSFFLSF